MRDVVVIDTNVLLRDPQAIFSYPGVELVIPQTVLSELDKIKTTRSDRELRFRGREISRILFELSEYGPLVEGVELDNDALIRVIPHDPNMQLPQPLTPKNADDRILGSAWQIKQRQPDINVTLITNDLNMLLKAQTLGVEVHQHQFEESPARLANWWRDFRRKRVNLVWVALPIALLLTVGLLWVLRVPVPVSTSALTSPLADSLSSFATQELTFLEALRREPENAQGWVQLAALQSDWGDALQNEGKQSEARGKWEDSADSYRRAVALQPEDAAIRTAVASIYFRLGNTDQTITELLQAQRSDPSYPDSYFALGWVTWKHNRDYATAYQQFETYLRLAPNGSRSKDAHDALQEIQKQLPSKSKTPQS